MSTPVATTTRIALGPTRSLYSTRSPSRPTPGLPPMFHQGPGALQSAGSKANQACVLPFRVMSFLSPKADPGVLSRSQGLESKRFKVYLVSCCTAAELGVKPQDAVLPALSPHSKVRRISPHDHHYCRPMKSTARLLQYSLKTQGFFSQLVVNAA